ncbi:hypothetical protein FB451DRAFT_1262632, partial [Mycena latifolia]
VCAGGIYMGHYRAWQLAWHAIFDTNVFSAVNMQQTFVSRCSTRRTPQCSSTPGASTASRTRGERRAANTAYIASKTVVKSLAEGLAHELRAHAGAAGGAR